MGKFKHLTESERIKIEHMYNKQKLSPRQIAAQLGRNPATIYREIERGLCNVYGKDYLDVVEYSHQIAHKKYLENAQAKGAQLKIGKDHALAAHIEDKIRNHKYSPAAVLGEIRVQGLQFATTISHTTLYRYIDENLFLGISNKNLPMGKRKKQKYQKVHRISYNQPMEMSIEDRPKEILERKEFGHWEMDTVVGKAKGKSTCLLVLTERKTRHEFLFKINQKSAAEVVKALDKLERRMGKAMFRRVFQSIATDNGCEFSDMEGMRKGARTVLYKCHPFSSCERGSNENANKLIRRFIPKGTPITGYTHKEIERIQNWMNNYPRRIHGYQTSGQLFAAELALLAA